MNAHLGIVVLAAGDGTRMRSATNKMLHPICGRPLVRLVLDVADNLNAAHTAVVLSPTTLESVRDAMGERYMYAVQAARLGTGHAVQQALPLMQGRTAQVVVLYGDTPLLRAETVAALCQLQREAGASLAMISFYADPPTGYGRVLRNKVGAVTGVVEERNATIEQRAITEVNSGVYCFDADWLWTNVDKLARDPIKGEYYLTDLVELAVVQRGTGAVAAMLVDDSRQMLGINDRVQLAEATAILRERLLTELMRSGVTVTDPASTYVDVGVQVGRDTTLLPGTLLQGSTVVGERCVVGPHAQLRNAKVEDGANVRFALVENTTVHAGETIGPFVHKIS